MEYGIDMRKFRISKRSSCGEEAPLSGEYGEFTSRKITPLFRDDPEEELAWFIEISSIEDLCRLVEENGKVMLTPSDEENGHSEIEIEILDEEYWWA